MRDGGYRPDPTEQRTINQWYPEKHPVHCSNCANTQVYTYGGKLMVRCSFGHHGTHTATQRYTKIMRMARPTSFRIAENCPDWSSMDD